VEQAESSRILIQPETKDHYKHICYKYHGYYKLPGHESQGDNFPENFLRSSGEPFSIFDGLGIL